MNVKATITKNEAINKRKPITKVIKNTEHMLTAAIWRMHTNGSKMANHETAKE